MSTFLDSKLAIVQNDTDDGQYALMYIPTRQVLATLGREDLVKIMRDCSLWLDEDEPSEPSNETPPCRP